MLHFKSVLVKHLQRGLQSVAIHGPGIAISECTPTYVRLDEAADILSLLKACAKQKDLCRGSSVHAAILKKDSLLKNCYIASALVNMYAKCGAPAKAAQVHQELPFRTAFSWSALIAGYVQHGFGKEALHCFEQMQKEGLSPDTVAFTCILKACGIIGAVEQGEEFHEDIVRQGLLQRDLVLGSALIAMYAKCGVFKKALGVLDELPVRDVVSWSGLIGGYALHGHGEEALDCFEWMQCEGVCPNPITFVCVLQACGSIGAVEKGEEIHNEIVRGGFLGKDIVLGNALIDMYASCGVLAKAALVLDVLPAHNLVTWNVLITRYAEFGEGDKVMRCYKMMHLEGLHPDTVTFISLLKGCSFIGATDTGEDFHEEILRQGWLEKDLPLGTALVDMYMKCGVFAKALEVLEKLPDRNIFLWNSLIAGYSQQGQAAQALNCFERMQLEGLSPNRISFICALKACGSIRAAERGKHIHEEMVKCGILGKDIALWNALVDMYAKCGVFSKAAGLLNELTIPNTVTWNALISGYVQSGQGEQVVNFFVQMQHEGFFPDAVTFIAALKACSSIGAPEKGKQIHDEIVKQGLLGNDVMLDTALVDMYAKCGAGAKAASLLNGLLVQDVVSWSALIAGYAQEWQGEEALKCFHQMQREGFTPNVITFISILKACGSAGAADKGEEIYQVIRRQGLLREDVALGNSLVNMYAKCGALGKAAQVLDELPVVNVVSWSALIVGYAQQGQGKEALMCFEWMQHKGISPDTVSLACILDACSRAGLLHEGEIYFTDFMKKYSIIPDAEHYTCMIDLYGRMGEFDKALGVIEKMPCADYFMWQGILGSCRAYGNLRLGMLVFGNTVPVINDEPLTSEL